MLFAWTERRARVRADDFLSLAHVRVTSEDDVDRITKQFILIVFLYYYLTLNAFT